MGWILKNKAILQISNFIQSSTIFFDITNGYSFVSHSDDGLNDCNALKKLANDLANNFSSKQDDSIFTVSKYYVIAMSLVESVDIFSPVIMGRSFYLLFFYFLFLLIYLSILLILDCIIIAQDNEIAVVIFLDNNAALETSSDPSVMTDGLKLLDSSCAESLLKDNINIHPSIHPDFLSKLDNDSNQISKASNFLVDTNSQCSQSDSTFIPRASNSMVLINAGRPFLFSIPALQYLKKSEGFVEDNMMAFVVILKSNILSS
jgi:hypothetical protein